MYKNQHSNATNIIESPLISYLFPNGGKILFSENSSLCTSRMLGIHSNSTAVQSCGVSGSIHWHGVLWQGTDVQVVCITLLVKLSTWHNPETPRKWILVRNGLHQVGLWACLLGVVLTVNWVGKTHPEGSELSIVLSSSIGALVCAPYWMWCD